MTHRSLIHHSFDLKQGRGGPRPCAIRVRHPRGNGYATRSSGAESSASIFPCSIDEEGSSCFQCVLMCERPHCVPAHVLSALPPPSETSLRPAALSPSHRRWMRRVGGGRARSGLGQRWRRRSSRSCLSSARGSSLSSSLFRGHSSAASSGLSGGTAWRGLAGAAREGRTGRHSGPRMSAGWGRAQGGLPLEASPCS